MPRSAKQMGFLHAQRDRQAGGGRPPPPPMQDDELEPLGVAPANPKMMKQAMLFRALRQGPGGRRSW